MSRAHPGSVPAHNPIPPHLILPPVCAVRSQASGHRGPPPPASHSWSAWATPRMTKPKITKVTTHHTHPASQRALSLPCSAHRHLFVMVTLSLVGSSSGMMGTLPIYPLAGIPSTGKPQEGGTRGLGGVEQSKPASLKGCGWWSQAAPERAGGRDSLSCYPYGRTELSPGHRDALALTPHPASILPPTRDSKPFYLVPVGDRILPSPTMAQKLSRSGAAALPLASTSSPPGRVAGWCGGEGLSAAMQT